MIYLNCLAKDLKNAAEIRAATDNHALIAVQTKNYATVTAAHRALTRWSQALAGDISISLGSADPKQGFFVRDVAKRVWARHVNQTLPLVGATTSVSKNPAAIVNGLIYPSGIVGQVVVSTGPYSSQGAPILAPVDSAMLLIKEMGGQAVKLFSMAKIKDEAEFTAVATACAKHDLILEITGGLSEANIEPWIKLARAAGVKTLIPHVYTALLDPATGRTDVTKVKTLWTILKRHYAP